MNILIALLPAIGWGLIPLIVNKVPNSKPVNQILGVGIGAVIVGLIVTLIQRPAMNLQVSLLAIISGAFWTMGQVGQFLSFTRIGVSKTMPISTGFQLIGNTIIGVLIFGDWKTVNQYVLGILALIFTSIGYWVYSAFPNAVQANAQALFLPQTIGILLGAIIYIAFTKRLVTTIKQPATWLDVLAGLSFGIGAYTYIISAQMNGITSAFIYSQLSVIISTVGGMTILGEHKYGKELVSTLIGLALIVVGAIL